MELEAWLVLLQASLPPAASLVALLKETVDAASLLAMSDSGLRSAGISSDIRRRLQRPDLERLAAFRAWLAIDGQALVPLSSDHYPPLLKTLPDPPLALWVRGNSSVLTEPQLAIVGSRNPSRGGLDNARRFAAALSDAGLTVTSGLALGIDGASHAGALSAHAPTVAVLGSGLDIIYPAEHGSLAESIAERGALVSEYAPGTAPQRHHFPCRNRVIAGLSVGTLVIEASRQSGSLITARLAGDYGREVFAIPGSIHNPMARGCHQLIRQGAKLVEDAADILRELATQLTPFLAAPPRLRGETAPTQDLDSGYQELLAAMGFDPVGLPELTKRSGLTAAELSSMLLVLELEGFVEALPGGRYSRIEKRDP